MKKISLGFLAVAIATAGGCGEASQSGVVVKSSSYGNKWPLNVAEARLDCEYPSIAFLEANGKRYALNGKALRAGLPRTDEILKDKKLMFLADFNEKAMQVCLDKKGRSE